MLVLLEDRRFAFFRWNRHRNDFVRETALGDRRGCALLASQRECILIEAAYVEFLGDVLRSFGHRVDAVFALHQRIDEAPADRCVLDLRSAREGAVAFAGALRRGGDG